MARKALDLSKIKPLDKASWAGAVDNLGGDVLAWMASTMMQGGTIAAVGLAASMSLNTTVAPFILRGVSLLGIDSGATPMGLESLTRCFRHATGLSATSPHHSLTSCPGVRTPCSRGTHVATRVRCEHDRAPAPAQAKAARPHRGRFQIVDHDRAPDPHQLDVREEANGVAA
jgi:hypothetical protein